MSSELIALHHQDNDQVISTLVLSAGYGQRQDLPNVSLQLFKQLFRAKVKAM
jgi:hypothetical protein